jgi:ketosteroid isomerase-like protein
MREYTRVRITDEKEVGVMSKGFILFAGLGLVLTVGCQPGVDIEAETQMVLAVLDSYVTSVETEDMDLYSTNVAQDPRMVNFGGFGDPIIGWDGLKAVMEGQNEALSDTKITVSEMVIHVSDDGQHAWATCTWDLKAVMGEAPIELPIRCTWVLDKREGRWVIVHFHKSMAAG